MFNGSVECSPGSNCYINCIGYLVCSSWFEIYAETANSLYLNCDGANACRYAKVYAPEINDSNLQITCDSTGEVAGLDSSACYNLNVYADNTTNISISCINGYDCYRTNFNLNNAQNVNIEYLTGDSGSSSNVKAENVRNSLYIKCNGEDSCKFLDVYCPNPMYGAICDIDCFGAESCSSMHIYVYNTEYKYLDLSCSQYSGVNFFQSSFFSDPDQYPLEIYCTENGVSYNDKTEVFYDGITFGCEDDVCCPDSFLVEIECGSSSKKNKCIIDCTEEDCNGNFINATDESSLSVICNGDEGGECGRYLKILCPSNGDCSIECNGVRDCEYYTVETYSNQSNIYLYCNEAQSCDDLILNTPNANSVYIDAAGWGM